MRRMKRLCLTVLLTLAILISAITVVKAVPVENNYSAVFSLTTENTNVKVGDEVLVNIVITSIKGFEGINTFIGTKVYNSEVFQYIEAVGQNGWEEKGDAGNIVLRKDSGISSSGVIATLKFKALKEVESETIKITTIDACSEDDDGDVYWEDGNVNEPSITFKVTSVSTDDPNKDPADDPNKDPADDPNKDPADDPNKDPADDPSKDPADDPSKDPTNENNKPNNDSNSSDKGNNNDKTTVKGDKIPQTGESYIGIVMLILGVVLTIALYAKYKMHENRMK